MELKITLNVKNKGEAYGITSLLKMQHEVTDAKLDGEVFEFTQKRDKEAIQDEQGAPSPNFY
jgi:hypothetical protein